MIVTLSLEREANLSGLFVDRAVIPSWLATDFEDTGKDEGQDETPLAILDTAPDVNLSPTRQWTGSFPFGNAGNLMWVKFR